MFVCVVCVQRLYVIYNLLSLGISDANFYYEGLQWRCNTKPIRWELTKTKQTKTNRQMIRLRVWLIFIGVENFCIRPSCTTT